jgi:hypothetical protein
VDSGQKLLPLLYNTTAGRAMRRVIAGRETTGGVTAAGRIEKRKAPQPRPRSLKYRSDNQLDRLQQLDCRRRWWCSRAVANSRCSGSVIAGCAGLPPPTKHVLTKLSLARMDPMPLLAPQHEVSSVRTRPRCFGSWEVSKTPPNRCPFASCQ